MTQENHNQPSGQWPLTLPSSVAIGGHEWQIIPRPNLLHDDNHYGCTIEARLAIEVEPTTPMSILRVSVLHELLHAIEATYLTPKRRSEEANIKTLADGLFEVLQRNPHLVNFLLAPYATQHVEQSQEVRS